MLEKLPLFALVARDRASSTVAVQQQAGAVGRSRRLPLAARVANAVVAYVRYLGDAVWPRDLAVFYPHPGAVPAVAGGRSSRRRCVAARRVARARAARARAPYLLVGWLWFLGTLVPVIGLVQVGQQALADRYTTCR